MRAGQNSSRTVKEDTVCTYRFVIARPTAIALLRYFLVYGRGVIGRYNKIRTPREWRCPLVVCVSRSTALVVRASNYTRTSNIRRKTAAAAPFVQPTGPNITRRI